MKPATTGSRTGDIAAALAGLFEQPRAGFLDDIREAAALARRSDERVARSLEQMAQECADLDVDRLEEVYTRTFELQPYCTPYAGPHLFGEEGFQRGRMLAGLRAGFERHGFEVEGELPDHVAVLLRFTARLEGDEREEFRAWFLALPLTRLAEALAPTANPYRHLAAAARDLYAPDGVPGQVTRALGRLGAAPAGGSCGGDWTRSDEP